MKKKSSFTDSHGRVREVYLRGIFAPVCAQPASLILPLESKKHKNCVADVCHSYPAHTEGWQGPYNAMVLFYFLTNNLFSQLFPWPEDMRDGGVKL